ncbi:MAG: hypothetical protein ACOYJA_06770 [Christensenellales bacterium]|jgi:hypothetical protein
MKEKLQDKPRPAAFLLFSGARMMDKLQQKRGALLEDLDKVRIFLKKGLYNFHARRYTKCCQAKMQPKGGPKMSNLNLDAIAGKLTAEKFDLSAARGICAPFWPMVLDLCP